MTGQLNNKGEEGLRTFYLFPSIRMHRHRGMFVSSINLWLEAHEPNHITNLEVKKHPHFIRLETLRQALAVTAVSTSGY